MEGISQEITGRIKQFNINAEPSNVGPRWRKWFGRFETYLTALNIDVDERKKVLLLYLASRLIIPKPFNKQHEGHFGIGRTKALLREKIWFPGVDNPVEKTVKMCIACQATTTLVWEPCI